MSAMGIWANPKERPVCKKQQFKRNLITFKAAQFRFELQLIPHSEMNRVVVRSLLKLESPKGALQDKSYSAVTMRMFGLVCQEEDICLTDFYDMQITDTAKANTTLFVQSNNLELCFTKT